MTKGDRNRVTAGSRKGSRISVDPVRYRQFLRAYQILAGAEKAALVAIKRRGLAVRFVRLVEAGKPVPDHVTRDRGVSHQLLAIGYANVPTPLEGEG